MAYVEGQTIHDADSHVMELPGAILPYVEARLRDEFTEKTVKKNALVEWSARAFFFTVFSVNSSRSRAST